MADEKKLSYFFLGMGIGVAVGILFAPKPGEETRRFLREKADEGKDYLKKRGDDLIDSAGEMVDRGKTVLNRQKDQLAAAVEAGRQAYCESTAASAAEPDPATGL
jgi:gas vesicle protein